MLAALAVLSGWIYIGLYGLTEVSETCTMGGDGLLPGLILGGPFALISILCLWFSRRAASFSFGHLLALGICLAFGIYLVLPQTWSVSILGHHSCGPGFDAYLVYVSAWNRWVPIIHAAIILIMAAMSLNLAFRNNTA